MSARDKAVELAQHYMVVLCPGVRNDSDGNAEVEDMIDAIIEAAADKVGTELTQHTSRVLSEVESTADSILGKAAGNAALKRTNEIRMSRARNEWIEKKRGTLSDQVVGLLEQAYEAGWHDREEG